MAIFDLFSKRQKKTRGEVPDVFRYDHLPNELRVQIIHILSDLLGDPTEFDSKTEMAFKSIHNILCREYGRFRLSERYGDRGDWRSAVFDFFMQTTTEEALDLIEISFRIGTDLSGEQWFAYRSKPTLTGPAASEELNARFREHGVGYQFESGELIRVDSQFIHAHAVKPTIAVLSNKDFSGANENS